MRKLFGFASGGKKCMGSCGVLDLQLSRRIWMDPEMFSTARNIEGWWRKTNKPIRREKEKEGAGP